MEGVHPVRDLGMASNEVTVIHCHANHMVDFYRFRFDGVHLPVFLNLQQGK